ncbi:MAG: acetoacetate metabolism regulatory protein AtoC [Gemmatimonadota bacterium]|nr:MAG: acetoacetate metabolism regulatory protein AtoC [Gemmatimonadota bacterium]
MLVRVLAGLDDPEEQRRIKDALLGPGVLISTLEPGGSLWECLAGSPLDLILLNETTLPEPALDSIRAVGELPGSPDILLMLNHADAETCARYQAAGVLTVLDPELSDGSLRDSLATIVERRRVASEQHQLATQEEYRLGDFVTSSPAMQSLIAVARRVATSDTTLLILGETGVGKEWLARAIHTGGERAAGPFVAVNCAAIPEALFESQLFGHKRGAFTGANRDHRGHFELAHRGTIFLDEIGDMPTHVQVKLLRVLQERNIQPVGAEDTIEVDTRVMAATNRDPKEDIEEGRLREDLYYRLAVVTMTSPALRERREDIPDLVENHFEIFRIKLRRRLYGITREAMEALVAYDWPGNVRELINVMERAVLLCPGEEITLRDLPETVASRRGAAGFLLDEGGGAAGLERWLEKPLREARREIALAFERRYLTEVLKRHQGRIADTAQHAGMTPRSLFDRMQQLGLRKEDFKG